MIALLKIPVLMFLALYIGWVFYLAVMSLGRAKAGGTLTQWTWALGYPVLALGLVLDCVLNAIVLSVVFLELPREWTMTARLKRHAQHRNKPRCLAIVDWFRQFVDPFDRRGRHV